MWPQYCLRLLFSDLYLNTVDYNHAITYICAGTSKPVYQSAITEEECFYLGAFDFVRVWPSKLHYGHLGFKHFSWIVARMMQLLFICLFIFCFWFICALIHSFSLIFRWDFISILVPHSSPFSPSLSSAPSHGLSYHTPTLTPPCFPWRLYVSWSLSSCTIRTTGLSCLIVGPGHLKIPSLPCWSLGRKRKEWLGKETRWFGYCHPSPEAIRWRRCTT